MLFLDLIILKAPTSYKALGEPVIVNLIHEKFKPDEKLDKCCVKIFKEMIKFDNKERISIQNLMKEMLEIEPLFKYKKAREVENDL